MSKGQMLGLAVSSMRDHMTDEGWQIFDGLSRHGYLLCGHGLPEPESDVRKLLDKYDPDIVVVNDKREWDVISGKRDFRDPKALFTNVDSLRNHRCKTFTILKDAHQRPAYHEEASIQMGIDAHIIYYKEEIVRGLAPFLGPVIRTYHTIDSSLVRQLLKDSSAENKRRYPAILSGAISGAYPLRRRLAESVTFLRHHRSLYPANTIHYYPHPGYHRNGCATPAYLRLLMRYKVAICTCSVYQYLLRKIIEATACGCIVITNLQSERVPAIDDNLVRISDDASLDEVASLVVKLASSYDLERQQMMSRKALCYYDHISITKTLADNINSFAYNHTLKEGL